MKLHLKKIGCCKKSLLQEVLATFSQTTKKGGNDNE
jgi:hypothetical protein